MLFRSAQRPQDLHMLSGRGLEDVFQKQGYAIHVRLRSVRGRRRPSSVLFWGLGVPGFLVVFAVFFGRVRGGVSGCFCFRSALPSSGLGGVGLGWGCFSPAVIAWPGLVLALPWLWDWCWFGFGFVWRV